MSRTKTRGNLCRDQRVDLAPEQQTPRGTPARATDLTDGQVWLLVELAARNGGHPADRVFTLYGFLPSEDDRAHLEWVAEINRPLWAPWLSLLPRRIAS